MNPNDLLAGLLQGGQGFAANPVQPPAPTAGADPASSELLQILQPNNIPMPETVEADPLNTKQRVLGSIFQGLSAYGAGLNPNVQANDVIGNLMQQNAEKANQENETAMREYAIAQDAENKRLSSARYKYEQTVANEDRAYRKGRDATVDARMEAERKAAAEERKASRDMAAARLKLAEDEFGLMREKFDAREKAFQQQLQQLKDDGEKQELLDFEGRVASGMGALSSVKKLPDGSWSAFGETGLTLPQVSDMTKELYFRLGAYDEGAKYNLRSVLDNFLMETGEENQALLPAGNSSVPSVSSDAREPTKWDAFRGDAVRDGDGYVWVDGSDPNAGAGLIPAAETGEPVPIRKPRRKGGDYFRPPNGSMFDGL